MPIKSKNRNKEKSAVDNMKAIKLAKSKPKKKSKVS